ncbi:hypothetical protein ATC00_24290 [Sinorhizobium americanum]|nr:hypothetical protein ATC00_24290 [Sinorhizobium americanum]
MELQFSMLQRRAVMAASTQRFSALHDGAVRHDCSRLVLVNKALVMANGLLMDGIRTSSHIIDSRSVKTTDGGGLRGFAGKKVKRRTGHMVTDTAGNVHEAFRTATAHPSVTEIVRERLCRRGLETTLAHIKDLVLEIVGRSDGPRDLSLCSSAGSWSGLRMARPMPSARQRLGASIAASEAWMFIAIIDPTNGTGDRAELRWCNPSLDAVF